MLPPVVDSFAREYGFIVTPSTELQTISEVKVFTEEIGKTGKWRGQALEGFVVRTHVSSDLPTKSGAGSAASPYTPGSSFFFKVKFDEPYMMYRDWREVTKTLLSKEPSVENVPKGKMRRDETRAYVRWIIEEIKRDKSQFSEFTKGKGMAAISKSWRKDGARRGRARFGLQVSTAEVSRLQHRYNRITAGHSIVTRTASGNKKHKQKGN